MLYRKSNPNWKVVNLIQYGVSGTKTNNNKKMLLI